MVVLIIRGDLTWLWWWWWKTLVEASVALVARLSTESKDESVVAMDPSAGAMDRLTLSSSPPVRVGLGGGKRGGVRQEGSQRGLLRMVMMMVVVVVVVMMMMVVVRAIGVCVCGSHHITKPHLAVSVLWCVVGVGVSEGGVIPSMSPSWLASESGEPPSHGNGRPTGEESSTSCQAGGTAVTVRRGTTCDPVGAVSRGRLTMGQRLEPRTAVVSS
jgi:hypothetical protein